MNFSTEKSFATTLDNNDPLKDHRKNFEIPKLKSGQEVQYFAGHSLGLMPKKAREYIEEELVDWSNYGVEGHFKGKYPWLPYHEFVAKGLAGLVGAKESEVVAMNTLTVNLHLMLVSFYKPTPQRYKILIEKGTFPSDKYAVDSQARFHGFDPNYTIIELESDDGMLTSSDKIKETIEEHKDELALVMLGNVNYLTGQRFDFKEITDLSHSFDIPVGFNLAHGAGNLKLDLHNWNVDFAVWCSYKYLNSGPGGIAGAFVHERHHGKKDIQRFEGWWGHDKESRFVMGPDFNPIPTAEAWQLSNPPIFQLASLRASLDAFHEAGLDNIFTKRDQLTGYLEFLLTEEASSFCKIQTPRHQGDRGSMLCVTLDGDVKKINETLEKEGVICDFRYPNIIRMAPIAQYTRYEDVYNLVQSLKRIHSESK